MATFTDTKLTDSLERQLIEQEIRNRQQVSVNPLRLLRRVGQFLRLVWSGIEAARPVAARGEW